MGSFFRTQKTSLAVFLMVVLTIVVSVWASGYRQALDPVAARGRSDLLLAADRLVIQLQRYREFAVLMADHPDMRETQTPGGREKAERVLLRASDKTGTLAAALLSTDGQIVASIGEAIPPNVLEKSFVRRAKFGALGSGRGVLGPREDKRVFYFAAPQFGNSKIVGIVLVAVSLDALEQDWRGDLPSIFFTDGEGQIIATNRSELLFWRKDGAKRMVSPDGRHYEAITLDFGPHKIWQQDWSPYVPQTALYITEPLPVVGLIGAAMIDVGPARRIAGLQAALVGAVSLFFGALMFLAIERRRVLADANQVLEERVDERTKALLSVNSELRHEVRERQEAQAALTRAQEELVQAGKLSALGQMSAGISHELNQPLMAIRSYAENGTAFLDRQAPERAAENLTRISDLARRMGRIIQNLRAFSRQESIPPAKIDVVAVLDTAFELTQARLQTAGVEMEQNVPKGPLWVRAGEVRLAQVLVNLISNAVDAMADSPEKRLIVSVEDGDELSVTVRDTGPGIEEPERLFDPFYTTKKVGGDEGMGLGLSISYGLVQSFGGTIRGSNADGGGAEFTVVLERWTDDELKEQVA